MAANDLDQVYLTIIASFVNVRREECSSKVSQSDSPWMGKEAVQLMNINYLWMKMASMCVCQSLDNLTAVMLLVINEQYTEWTKRAINITLSSKFAL